MRALTRKSIADVTRRKLRAGLTILGIAIGVMGLAAIGVASDQLSASFKYSTDASGAADITFYTTPADTALVPALAAQPHVTAVEARVYQPTRWAVPSGHYPFNVVGVQDFNALRFDKFQVIEGRLPGTGEILLDSGDRAAKPIKIGDTVNLEIRGQTQSLTVSGFARTRGLPNASIVGFATGYMSQPDAEALFQSPGVNEFALSVDDPTQAHAVAQQLASYLETQHVSVLETTVGHDDHGISTVTNGLFGLMRALSIVALLLSVFLLMSTITTLINEQVPIIGVMKTIGAQGGQVMRSYLLSVAIYGVIGTALGLALGLLGGYALVRFMGDLFVVDIGPLNVNPTLLLIAALVGIGAPVLAAALPVYFGSRITVRQALSGYGLENGAGQRRSIGRVFGFIPQTVQLGMRGLFRKRTRAALTLLALAISGAAFLAVQTTAYSFNTFLGELLGQYDADVFVGLARPASLDQIQTTLGNVQGISRVERFSQAGIQTQWGQGLLTGVETDAQLYHKQVVSGRWFTEGEQNVALVNENAAKKYGVKVGDTISFHDDLHSATWTVIGIAHDGNNPTEFGVLLAPASQVNAFLRLPDDYASGLMVKSTSARQSDIDALATRIDDTLSGNGYPAVITTAQQEVDRNQSQFLIIYVLLYTVAGIIALVGAIGLFNTLAMSVLERRRELGILRAMGATGRKVAQVFWTEGVALGVVAWAVAIALGVPVAYGFVRLIGSLLVEVPFAFDLMSLLWMLVFVVAVASVASLGPVWGAARVRIAQTLRYE
ncbi:MAG TPA: FtsX-like permease family protein [Ktedonobacterales bacterium]|jgi:putative ABC transport system permease protein